MNKNTGKLLITTLLFTGSAFIGSIKPVYAVNVPAGPIWSNDDAQVKCPAVCQAAGGTWDGNWTTVIWGKSSVCSCQ